MTEAEGNDHIMLDDGTQCDQHQEPELIPLEGATSKIWKHFRLPAKDDQYIEKVKRKQSEIICGRCRK